MNYFTLMEHIKKDKIPHILLLYGTETYFIQKICAELEKKVLQQETENLSEYDLTEIPIQQVITDVETYPFFGGKKLVFAYNPVFLQSKLQKLPFEHDIKALEQYIKNPVSHSIFVLIAPYEKLDQRKKVTKLILDQAFAVECQEVKANNLEKWIYKMAKFYNITIDSSALGYLQTELTTDLQLLENEIHKLSLYVGKGGNVTKDIAREIVSQTMDSTALSLVDAVMERNYEKAFSIYEELSLMNEEPIALIALLAFQYRMMLQVKLMRKKGYTQYQMQRQIGAHSYVIKIALNRERKYSMEQIRQIIHQLTETDAAIKFGKTEKNLAFELLLYDLLST